MATLGETLRERRISLGITIEQAQDATRIRGRLLEALESGSYDKLPNPGYVRGFISSYARLLELDPQPLLQIYKAETGERRSQDLNLPQVDEAVARSGEQHALPWGAAVGVVALIVVVAIAIWGIGRLTSSNDTQPAQPLPVSGASGTAGDDPSNATGTAEGEPDAATVPFTLVVAVDSDGASWIRIVVDKKQAYEGTLTGGQSKTYEVTKSATVKVGKPSSVTIEKDGKVVQIPEGDTPTVKLTADVTQ
ncbi:MAG: DUF4115 domain-containing protein [Coriobacteriia bacterium]|nr:DUF4115 domain-containing protein [Coriobacteriia bacterium]